VIGTVPLRRGGAEWKAKETTNMAREPIKKSIRFEVFKRDSFTCQYCGQKSPDVVLQIDHITPVAHGGDNDILNLVTACKGCNAGKSDRVLTETAAIDRRRSQLEDLEQRRQQLAMLHEWHLSLIEIDDQAATLAGDLWFRITGREGHALSDSARSELQKLIKRNGFSVVCDAVKKAAQAVKRSSKEESEAYCEWFWKIGRIIATQKLEEKDPGVGRLLYIRGILRNRCSHLNEQACIALLKEAKDAGACLDWMEGFAKQVYSWSQFRNVISETLREWAKEEEEGKDGTHP
jgi:hypothetical protein